MHKNKRRWPSGTRPDGAEALQTPAAVRGGIPFNAWERFEDGYITAARDKGERVLTAVSLQWDRREEREDGGRGVKGRRKGGKREREMGRERGCKKRSEDVKKKRSQGRRRDDERGASREDLEGGEERGETRSEDEDASSRSFSFLGAGCQPPTCSLWIIADVHDMFFTCSQQLQWRSVWSGFSRSKINLCHQAVAAPLKGWAILAVPQWDFLHLASDGWVFYWCIVYSTFFNWSEKWVIIHRTD